MSKKIVLVEPQYGTYGFHYIPQGLLAIAAFLESDGHDVTICNERDRIPSCDILGISSTLSQYTNAITIGRRADAGTIVVGGAMPTTLPVDAVRSRAFDYVIIGDGERPMLDLANNMSKREIPGLVYVDSSGAVIINPNLDYKYRYPDNRPQLPAYHLLQNIGTCVNVTRNREYSWKWGWKRKNRPKYWEDFEKEILTLIDMGVRSVHVTDEHFGGWHNSIKSTVRALDKLDKWTCRSTTTTVLNRNLDSQLRNSRCSLVELNIITASKRLLSELDGLTANDHNLAYDRLVNAKLRVQVHATIGLPGETVESIMETWRWLSGKRARISTFVPLPGTQYYEDCQNYAHFGFDITGTNFTDFIIDDASPLHHIPWLSNTISPSKFMEMRNNMVKEFGVSHG